MTTQDFDFSVCTDMEFNLDTSNCVPAFDESKLNPEFRCKIIALQHELPFLKVNSAYRSQEWEHKKGRPGTSQHCFGRAIDLHCSDSGHRYALVECAMRLGFHRILVYPTFVHLDDMPGVWNKLIWMLK